MHDEYLTIVGRKKKEGPERVVVRGPHIQHAVGATAEESKLRRVMTVMGGRKRERSRGHVDGIRGCEDRRLHVCEAWQGARKI